VCHGEGGDRHLGLGVAARVTREVAAPFDPRGLGHAGHMPLDIPHDAHTLQLDGARDEDLVPMQRLIHGAEGLADLARLGL
jgi:hypothetical protein